MESGIDNGNYNSGLQCVQLTSGWQRIMEIIMMVDFR